jgi:hypothetical protein
MKRTRGDVMKKTKKLTSKIPPKPRRGPKVPTLAQLRESLPNPEGVAALEGMLDAVENIAKDNGITDEAAPAMRAVFGMLFGIAISDTKGVTLEVDGVGSIPISKVDAQHVAMQACTDLTRLHVNEMMTRLVGKKPIKLNELVGKNPSPDKLDDKTATDKKA